MTTPRSQYRANIRKRPSVLIIEPQQNTRIFLEMTLSREGIRVFSAVSLRSALLQLRVLQPDLIIISSDGQEVGENGTAARIKAISVAPLLAMGDRSNALCGSDAIDTLPNSFNAGLLCAKVVELLSRSDLPEPV